MEPVSSAKVYKDPLRIYFTMLEDIEHAKKYIYLETYRFEDDPIGIKFKNLLTKKAKEGIKIMLLLDAWGTSVSLKFFKELIEYGGQVTFFKKIRFSLNLFSSNHERDHRKLLLIDDEISYISSINISNYNLNWREFSLRMTGEITRILKSVFLRNYHLKNTYKFDKKGHTRLIRYEGFEIVRDVPSVRFQRIRKKLVQCIKKAKNEVIIETPYFLPTYLLMENMIKAARRGVDVKVVMPHRSDVAVVNILRQYYLGRLYEAGVKILYYQPTNLHSKIMLADDRFYIGSANFDYRSFRYQFEIGLFGNHPDIYKEVKEYSEHTLTECIPFDYQEWKNRRYSLKIIERILLPLKHFL